MLRYVPQRSKSAERCLKDNFVTESRTIHLVGIATRSLQTGVRGHVWPGSAAIGRIDNQLRIQTGLEAHAMRAIDLVTTDEHGSLIARIHKPQHLLPSPALISCPSPAKMHGVSIK